MERSLSSWRPWARMRPWHHGEAALLLAALGLLFWLESRPAASSPEGYLGASAASLLAALAALWLAPGFVLWRLSHGERRGPWWEAVPFAFGLGLAWLLVSASLVMVLHSDMATLAQVVVVGNAILTLSYLGLRRRGRRSSAGEDTKRDVETGTWPSLWLALAVLAAAGRALYVSAMRPYRFTAAGDEWVYMKAIRQFLESATITDVERVFDVWDLVLALLLRLSGLEVLSTYRRLLAPLLAALALLAFLALARRVLRDANGVCLALTVLVLYCLSDVWTRGEGAGMGLLVRITEDKYACFFIALPLAQAIFLDFLGSGSPLALGVCAALTLSATLLQPFAVPWLALSCGGVFISGLLTGRSLVRGKLLFGVATTIALGVGLAFWLRSLRPPQYFRLYDPSWTFNAFLQETRFRQLLVLSLEKAWYLVHPWQVSHPLVMTALFGSLFLLRSFRRSLQSQFLVLSTLVPTLLVFNPVTAPFLGGWVTPWRLHWLLWIVPTPLILGALLHELLERLESLGRRRWAPGSLIGVLGVLALAGLALALGDRMADSLRAFKTKNVVLVKAEEREFMRAVSRDPSLRGRVLAPAGESIRLPAWTTRLKPVIDIESVRMRVTNVTAPAQAFLRASTIGPKEAAYLSAARIDYVMAETGSPIERAMRDLPGPFHPVQGNDLLCLYAWRPQYWSALPVP